MTVLDLFKATVIFGSSAFVIYSVPAVSQALIIAALSLVWLSYAYKTFSRLVRR